MVSGGTRCMCFIAIKSFCASLRRMSMCGASAASVKADARIKCAPKSVGKTSIARISEAIKAEAKGRRRSESGERAACAQVVGTKLCHSCGVRDALELSGGVLPQLRGPRRP